VGQITGNISLHEYETPMVYKGKLVTDKKGKPIMEKRYASRRFSDRGLAFRMAATLEDYRPGDTGKDEDVDEMTAALKEIEREEAAKYAQLNGRDVTGTGENT